MDIMILAEYPILFSVLEYEYVKVVGSDIILGFLILETDMSRALLLMVIRFFTWTDTNIQPINNLVLLGNEPGAFGGMWSVDTIAIPVDELEQVQPATGQPAQELNTWYCSGINSWLHRS